MVSDPCEAWCFLKGTVCNFELKVHAFCSSTPYYGILILFTEQSYSNRSLVHISSTSSAETSFTCIPYYHCEKLRIYDAFFQILATMSYMCATRRVTYLVYRLLNNIIYFAIVLLLIPCPEQNKRMFPRNLTFSEKHRLTSGKNVVKLRLSASV